MRGAEWLDRHALGCTIPKRQSIHLPSRLAIVGKIQTTRKNDNRVLFDIASELLLTAARSDLPQLDEKLFLQHTTVPQKAVKRAAQR